MKRSSVLCVLSLMLFYADIYPILAQAPTTPKIAFMTARNGNRDIYLMNPDGSKMERITRHRAADALLYHAFDKNDDLQMFKVSLADGVPAQLTPSGFWHYVGDWFDPAFALPVSPQPHLLATTWSKMKKITSPE